METFLTFYEMLILSGSFKKLHANYPLIALDIASNITDYPDFFWITFAFTWFNLALSPYRQ